MYRIALFLIILFALAIGFAWLADRPGTVTINWESLGYEIEATLLNAMIALAAIVAFIMMLWWVVSAVLHSPQSFGRWRSGRRRDKGYNALSRGLVAVNAGNAPLARRLTKESSKLLSNEPLVELLDAQTALLEGKRADARKKFEQMLDDPDTKLLGLHGLYREAEKEGEGEAAAHFAKQAYEVAPETPWAALGLLKAQGVVGDWEKALKTLDANRSSGFYDKSEYNRKRAVILTALAMQEENHNPDKARTHALAAHKLAPSLVPAAVIGATLCSRHGDLRKAAKILETTWKQVPHPDIADSYINLRSGDSALDKLKRAQTLSAKKSHHSEGQFAIAKAAIEAGEFETARKAMEAVMRSKPTERASLLMADIEEAEHGDQGRVREWLARAVHAPRDAAWTADGFVSEEWAPFSPVTGELDAFEWKVPVEQIGGPAQAVDYSDLVSQPVKEKIRQEAEDGEPTVIELAVAASTVSAAATVEAAPMSMPEPESLPDDDDIVEAEIIDVAPLAEPEKSASDVDDSSEHEKPEAPAETAEIIDLPIVEEKPDPAAPPAGLANLDPDNDGVLDHRPDDPGVPVDEVPKKKNRFF